MQALCSRSPRQACPPSVPTVVQDQLGEALAQLPAPSQLVLSLAALDGERSDYFERVQQLLSGDPGFAARVLRLANSSAFAAARPVTSLSGALLRVGARVAADLMLAQALQQAFPDLGDAESELWAHCVVVACFMRRLAPLVASVRLDAGEAYTAGLLHDIGRLVMLMQDPAGFQAIEQECWADADELAGLERARFGYSHAEIGGLALRRWEMPETFVRVARDHHLPAERLSRAPVCDAMIGLLRDVDGLATVVAREGPGWLDDVLCATAWIDTHMLMDYRGDTTHRIGVLRGAAREAHAVLDVLGLTLPRIATVGAARV